MQNSTWIDLAFNHLTELLMTKFVPKRSPRYVGPGIVVTRHGQLGSSRGVHLVPGGLIAIGLVPACLLGGRGVGGPL